MLTVMLVLGRLIGNTWSRCGDTAFCEFEVDSDFSLYQYRTLGTCNGTSNFLQRSAEYLPVTQTEADREHRNA